MREFLSFGMHKRTKAKTWARENASEKFLVEVSCDLDAFASSSIEAPSAFTNFTIFSF